MYEIKNKLTFSLDFKAILLLLANTKCFGNGRARVCTSNNAVVAEAVVEIY